MQNGIEEGYGTYFITGLRTVVDGKFGYGKLKSRSSTFDTKIPLLSSSIPADQRSFSDIAGSSGGNQGTVRSEVWEAPGEQIFAVAYRKVNFRTTLMSRKQVDAARLKGEDVWMLLADHRTKEKPEKVEIVQEVYLDKQNKPGKDFLDFGEEGWGLTSVAVGEDKWMFGEDDDEVGDEEEMEEEW